MTLDETNQEQVYDDLGTSQGTEADFNRRKLMRRMGLGVAGAAALGAMSTAGLVGSTTPAAATNQGAGPPDADILNFALNLEYLEAEFYLYAATGSGLPASLRNGGTFVQGPVNPGLQVPFTSPAIAQYAQRIAVDEMAHVAFLRSALGAGVFVNEPNIDVGVGPTNAFSKLAVAAGLIPAGGTFNPYLNDITFLLAASIFEDVGVTAYAGAARFIGNPNYVEAAAGILGTEAYHSGAIRTLLGNIGAGVAFGQISALRAMLSGKADDQGILIPGNNYNFIPNDTNALVFRRTTAQILNIVYGAPNTAGIGGLFFPAGMNGNIR